MKHGTRRETPTARAGVLTGLLPPLAAVKKELGWEDCDVVADKLTLVYGDGDI